MVFYSFFFIQRFTTPVSCSPASTKYKDPRMAMESLKKLATKSFIYVFSLYLYQI